MRLDAFAKLTSAKVTFSKDIGLEIVGAFNSLAETDDHYSLNSIRNFWFAVHSPFRRHMHPVIALLLVQPHQHTLVISLREVQVQPSIHIRLTGVR